MHWEKCAYLIMNSLCYASSLTMVTVTKVTRLTWLSENLLTHQNHHFLDGDLCVCVRCPCMCTNYTRPSYVFHGTAAWLLPSIQTTYTYVLATSATLFSGFHAVYILVVSTAMCTMSNSNGNAPVHVDVSAYYRVRSLPVLLCQSSLPPSDPFYRISPLFYCLCMVSWQAAVVSTPFWPSVLINSACFLLQYAVPLVSVTNLFTRHR